MPVARVYLEVGHKSVFAVALDWPGWCRRTKTSDLAIDELERYRSRYEAMVTGTFSPGPIDVIGTTTGNGTTDFGAPGAEGPWDEQPLAASEVSRQVALLEDCWRYFDAVVDAAPLELRKGPKGGGRNRDAIADHVREAERAYSSKIGSRVPPRTPWVEQRAIVIAALGAGAPGSAWPLGYAIRRFAWHVTDHAWEIEDKSA